MTASNACKYIIEDFVNQTVPDYFHLAYLQNNVTLGNIKNSTTNTNGDPYGG